MTTDFSGPRGARKESTVNRETALSALDVVAEFFGRESMAVKEKIAQDGLVSLLGLEFVSRVARHPQPWRMLRPRLKVLGLEGIIHEPAPLCSGPTWFEVTQNGVVVYSTAWRWESP
jgi:hypothetical protein